MSSNRSYRGATESAVSTKEIEQVLLFEPLENQNSEMHNITSYWNEATVQPFIPAVEIREVVYDPNTTASDMLRKRMKEVLGEYEKRFQELVRQLQTEQERRRQLELERQRQEENERKCREVLERLRQEEEQRQRRQQTELEERRRFNEQEQKIRQQREAKMRQCLDEVEQRCRQEEEAERREEAEAQRLRQRFQAKLYWYKVKMAVKEMYIAYLCKRVQTLEIAFARLKVNILEQGRIGENVEVQKSRGKDHDHVRKSDEDEEMQQQGSYQADINTKKESFPVLQIEQVKDSKVKEHTPMQKVKTRGKQTGYVIDTD